MSGGRELFEKFKALGYHVILCDTAGNIVDASQPKKLSPEQRLKAGALIERMRDEVEFVPDPPYEP